MIPDPLSFQLKNVHLSCELHKTMPDDGNSSRSEEVAPIPTTTTTTSTTPNTTTTKQRTNCQSEHNASLKCQLENYENKHAVCASFYEAYKQCRKKENDERKEANRGKTIFSWWA